jgi:hypothetical protein
MWPTLAACAASAALAFGLGRITAPSGAQQKNPFGESHPARNTAAKRDASLPASSGNATDDATEPLDATVKKDAEIIALLSRLKTLKNSRLGPELIGLAAWVNAANMEDLELLTTLGREILPEGNSAREVILPLAFTRWADLDAPNAFAAYLALPENERTPDIAALVFEGWMRKGSPREALDHALALQRTASEGDTLGKDFVGDLLNDLFKGDRAQAKEIVNEFAVSKDPLERQAAEHAVEGMMYELADNEGHAAALAWINQWPVTAARAELRSELLKTLLSSADDAHTLAAMDLFAQIPNPDSSIVLSVARKKASRSVPEAQTWLMTLPPGEARGAALNGLYEVMAMQDNLPEFARWLATKSPHPDFDATFSQLAMDAFKKREDFPAAIKHVMRMTDPTNATQLKSQMISRWLEFDPENAVNILGPELGKAMLDPAP